MRPGQATETVVADEPTLVISWRLDDLRQLFFRRPALAVHWNALVGLSLQRRATGKRHSKSTS
jgi:hypothetical protein